MVCSLSRPDGQPSSGQVYVIPLEPKYFGRTPKASKPAESDDQLPIITWRVIDALVDPLSRNIKLTLSVTVCCAGQFGKGVREDQSGIHCSIEHLFCTPRSSANGVIRHRSSPFGFVCFTASVPAVALGRQPCSPLGRIVGRNLPQLLISTKEIDQIRFDLPPGNER